MVASLFDPLGLISLVVITGKLPLQQCCRNKPRWDDELPSDITNQWTSKTKSMKITTLEFPRYYKPINFGETVIAEVHSHILKIDQQIGSQVSVPFTLKLEWPLLILCQYLA